KRRPTQALAISHRGHIYTFARFFASPLRARGSGAGVDSIRIVSRAAPGSQFHAGHSGTRILVGRGCDFSQRLGSALAAAGARRRNVGRAGGTDEVYRPPGTSPSSGYLVAASARAAGPHDNAARDRGLFSMGAVHSAALRRVAFLVFFATPRFESRG